MEDEWKKLQRELKILRAKKEAGGILHPKDKARLQWLEERLGDAEAIKRVAIEEPVDAGPKVTTSEDHYAVEVSENLLKQAERQKLERPFEQEQIGKKQRVFEARDARQRGGPTFKQQGLSQFAVEVTDDLRGGEVGLEEVPQEAEQAAQKMDFHKVVYAQDETERLTKKPAGKANPFAIEAADPLLRGMEKAAVAESLVPDNAAKSFTVEVDLEDSATRRHEEMSEEARSLLQKLGGGGEAKDDVSLGARTTHQAEVNEEEILDEELLRQAIDYAEKKGLVEQEHVWAADDEGHEIEALKEPESNLKDAFRTEGRAPPPAPRARWSDEAPTRPAAEAAKSEDLIFAAVAEQARRKPATIPQPPERPASPAAPTAAEAGGVLIPEPPESESTEVLIPEPPADQSPAPPPPRSAPPPPVIHLAPTEETLPESDLPAVADEAIPDLSDEALELEITPGAEDGGGGGDLQADDFWGLEGGAPAAAPRHTKPPPAVTPPPAPAPPTQSRPLPPLSKQALDATVKQKPPKPTGPRITALVSLFEEEDSPTRAAPGRAPAAKKSAGLFSPAARGGVANDLRGPRKVTVHYKDGVSKRGSLQEVNPLADVIQLEPATSQSGKSEKLSVEALKAIFVILPRGMSYPQKPGQAVRLVMMDGRRLEGFTNDYHPGNRAFTLFPKEDQGNIERVIVYNDAVKNIWFD